MKVVRRTERPPLNVDVAGAEDVSVSRLVAESDGAPNSAMRLFEIGVGGCTPRHTHNWEHVVYVLEGEGAIASASAAANVVPGDAALVEAGEEHQFLNRGQDPFKFICVVPIKGDV
jgi:quercetin dioxygenase-like cupin family protein